MCLKLFTEMMKFKNSVYLQMFINEYMALKAYLTRHPSRTLAESNNNGGWCEC
ncbi:asb108 [Agrotis segetum nucleopolyhedrovirus B]|uniref:Asb108 n=1 Tax=Agrotis segetum nucleopolyhedrovirus B TaxID=1580580 RepID=A0A0A7KVE7_9ABAC|nr:asb108 [Agrotis segetum nucleopolyhedrovirus B]AIZ48665.1 asb108 [Agrotis segetum nucleopolyhedrovirus B]